MAVKGNRIKSALKRYFATGLVSLLPTVVVGWILYFLVGKLMRATNWVLNYVEPETAWAFEVLFPLIFLILAASLIIIVGVVSTTIAGRGTARVWERLITRIPVVRHVYVSVRELSRALSLRKKQVFKAVVLVKYPQTGLYQLGFVTSDGIKDFVDDELISVFVPSTPNPTTGFLFMAQPEQVTTLDLTVEEAFKLILSGGFVLPGANLDFETEINRVRPLKTDDVQRKPSRETATAETTS